MADEYTTSKSLNIAGPQAPDLTKEEVKGEIVAGTPQQQLERDILNVSHGAPHPLGERVKVDQPPDVSKLIPAEKFSGAPLESKGNENE